MNLKSTVLVTTDVPKLASFYKEITGLESSGVEQYQEFHSEGGNWSIVHEAVVASNLGGGAQAGRNQSLILGFEVADVDTEFARLESQVGEIVLEPTTQPWGNRTFIFKDPEGNLVEFFTPQKQEVVG